MKTMFIRRALGCLALFSAVLPAACSSGEPEPVGTLELSLRATGSQGTVYGLEGRFVLNDPENLSFNASATEIANSVTLNPRVGTYALELCSTMTANGRCAAAPGFQLFKLTCSNGQAVATCAPPATIVATAVTGAQLTTPNPQTVSVLANQSTTATFAFTVPGEGSIVFARGNLNINVSVTEGFADGQPCSTSVECQSKVCTMGVCATASCADGVQNGAETGPDCGGMCPMACGGAGIPCMGAGGCPANQVCQGGVCVNAGGAPSCTDGIQNGMELGVDCGGPCPNACGGGTGGVGSACMSSATCQVNLVCQGGVCTMPGATPSCTDGIRNGDEAGPDCGGTCATQCPSGFFFCFSGMFCGPGRMCGIDQVCP